MTLNERALRLTDRLVADAGENKGVRNLFRCMRQAEHLFQTLLHRAFTTGL
jgi:hypothetical protein